MKKLYHLFALLIVISLLAACAGGPAATAPDAQDAAPAADAESAAGAEDTAAADADQLEAPALA
ncbi:MAG: hypothetical protein KDE19_06765, partial [Caldilineaceae bacterium]|nr:hypothetical protein [Caldilineaceae bacterium]